MLDLKIKYCIDLMHEIPPEWKFLFFSDGNCEDFVRRECPGYMELYDWYPRPVLKRPHPPARHDGQRRREPHPRQLANHPQRPPAAPGRLNSVAVIEPRTLTVMLPP